MPGPPSAVNVALTEVTFWIQLLNFVSPGRLIWMSKTNGLGATWLDHVTVNTVLMSPLSGQAYDELQVTLRGA